MPIASHLLATARCWHLVRWFVAGLLCAAQLLIATSAIASPLVIDGYLLTSDTQTEPKSALAAPATTLTALDPSKRVDLNSNRTAWLRFHRAAQPQAVQSVIEVPTMGLDKITLHTWVAGVQQAPRLAGELLPVALRSSRNTAPRFDLNEQAGLDHAYVLEISHRRAVKIRLAEFSPEAYRQRLQSSSLSVGLALGLLLFAGSMAFVYGRVIKDSALLGFAAWSTALALLVVTISGIGSVYLWPNYPANTSWMGSITAFVCAAGFTILIYLGTSIRYRSSQLRRAFKLLMLAHIVAIGVACLTETVAWRTGVGRVFHVMTALADLALLVRAMRWGDAHARWLIAARLCLLTPVAMTILGNQGWSDGELGRMVILFVAFCSAQMLALIALLVRNRAKRSHHQMLASLNEVEPESGLMKSALFQYQIERECRINAQTGSTSQVMVVNMVNHIEVMATLEPTLRLRVTQSVASELKGGISRMDEAAQLGSNRFGVLVLSAASGLVARENAMRLLARLLGVGPRLGLPTAPRFQIAFALIPSRVLDDALVVLQLHRLLDAKFDEDKIAIFDLHKDALGGEEPVDPIAPNIRSKF